MDFGAEIFHLLPKKKRPETALLVEYEGGTCCMQTNEIIVMIYHFCPIRGNEINFCRKQHILSPQRRTAFFYISRPHHAYDFNLGDILHCAGTNLTHFDELLEA